MTETSYKPMSVITLGSRRGHIISWESECLACEYSGRVTSLYNGTLLVFTM